jgi:hypothetical protein
MSKQFLDLESSDKLLLSNNTDALQLFDSLLQETREFPTTLLRANFVNRQESRTFPEE